MTDTDLDALIRARTAQLVGQGRSPDAALAQATREGQGGGLRYWTPPAKADEVSAVQEPANAVSPADREPAPTFNEATNPPAPVTRDPEPPRPVAGKADLTALAAKVRRLAEPLGGKTQSVSMFLRRCEDAGLCVKVTVAQTGRLSGFRFATEPSHEGYKGSEIDRRLRWHTGQSEPPADTLQGLGLTWEPERDLAEVQRQKARWVGEPVPDRARTGGLASLASSQTDPGLAELQHLREAVSEWSRAVPAPVYEIDEVTVGRGGNERGRETSYTREELLSAKVLGRIRWACSDATGAARQIYVLPLSPAIICIDDVPSDKARAARGTAAAVETSPGNAQVWVRFPEPVPDETRPALTKALTRLYGGGRSAGYGGRLPGTKNWKPERVQEEGPPAVILLHARGEVVSADLTDKLFSGARRKVEQDKKLRAAAQINQPRRPGGWREAGLDLARIYEDRMEKTIACLEASGSENVRFGSDFYAAMYCLKLGYRPDDVRGQIMESSRKIQEDGRKPEPYADSVMRAVERRMGQARQHEAASGSAGVAVAGEVEEAMGYRP